MADPNRNTEGAPPREIHIEEKRKAGWLPWLLLALGLLALLFALSRCNRGEQVVTPVATPSATPTAAPVATAALPLERVVLPNGRNVDLERSSLNYELQTYLASAAPAPRTFTFDKLNFDTGSSAIRAADQGTMTALGQILAAYPKALVRLVGYADSRGASAANQKLGAERARSVATALTSSGIAQGRVSTASGGESDPVDSNTTPGGRFENRRTELVVTAK